MRKKHFDKIKQARASDQSFLGRPFSLNDKFKDDRSYSSSQVLAEPPNPVHDPNHPNREEQDQDSEAEDNSSSFLSEQEGEKKIPVTAHALKKWNDTKSIHCFESQTSVNMFDEIRERNELLLFCEGNVPRVKFVYAIKESNMGKLDTHRHFFAGFCEELHPRYCSLIDVGTRFDDHTYFGFIHMGEIKSKLGGISQEVEVMWKWSPLVISQFMDYKLDQILKSAEGLYGLVQILPGAHQFLKWRGVRGKALDIYIEGTEDGNYEEKKDALGIFKRNVFLTEDKLMTALLVLRDDQVHTIEYLPGAKAYTDVPSTTAAMLRQRRRWLNGGFSTTLYGLAIYCRQYKRSQMRKKHPCIGFMLFLQLVYSFLQIFVQTTIALSLVTTYKFLFLLEDRVVPGTLVPGLEGIGLLNVVFFTVALFVFILALLAKSRNKNIALVYEILSYVLMVLNVFKLAGIFLILHQAYQGELTSEGTEDNNGEAMSHEGYLLVMAVISLYFFLINFLVLFLIKPREFCCKLHRFLISIVLYLLFQNTFFLMVKLYLVCNFHDVSWGSRAASQKKSSRVERSYRLSTVLIIGVWLLFNALLVFLIEFFYQNELFIFAMGLLVFIWTTVRALEALVYWINYCRSFRFRLYGHFLNVKQVYQDSAALP